MYTLVSGFKSAVDAIDHFAKSRDYALVSNDGFAHTVYQHKQHSDWVIKLPRSVSLAKTDPCLQFIQNACAIEVPNPLLPRLYENRFHLYPDGTYAIIMERLTVNPLMLDRMFCKNMESQSVIEVFDHVFKVYHEQGILDDLGERACELLKIVVQNLINFLEMMITMGFGPRELDIHEYNMGWRANGQVVIFDPVGS